MGRVKELWQALIDAGKTISDFESKEEELKEAIKLKDEQLDQELQKGDWDVDCDENGPYFVYTGDRHDA